MAMTSDSGRGMTVEERDAFLTSGTMFAKVATTMADGWPVVSPVWFDWLAEENAFLVISKARTSMVQNLHRDPRCGLLVDNPGLPYMRVSVLGEAEFLPEDFDWITPARKMAEPLSRRAGRRLRRNDVRISQRALSRPSAKDDHLERRRVRPHLLPAHHLARRVRPSIAEEPRPMSTMNDRDFVGYGRSRPRPPWSDRSPLALSLVLNYEEGRRAVDPQRRCHLRELHPRDLRHRGARGPAGPQHREPL